MGAKSDNFCLFSAYLGVFCPDLWMKYRIFISIVDISANLENIDIDIDNAILKISISISIRLFWKISISISIRSIWEISISISISIRRSWKYRYLKRILTIPLSTFMDIVVNCIEWHSMKFIQKVIKKAFFCPCKTHFITPSPCTPVKNVFVTPSPC